MRGEDVKQLQRRLRELGFSVTSEDGVFGPELDQAVREFQAAGGLEMDGVVGPGTYGAIDAAEEPTAVTESRATLVEVPSEPSTGAEPAGCGRRTRPVSPRHPATRKQFHASSTAQVGK